MPGRIRLPKGFTPDVVFVGGGPVGLWTAIQTKQRTGKNILVLERYQEYKRDSIRLRLDPSSFSGMAGDEGLKEIVKSWKNKKIVPIKEMEEALVKRAEEVGIRILRGVTAEPKKLSEQFPKTKVFIGADGARSTVRKEIFGDEMRFDSNLQYIARVQYIVKENEQETDGFYGKIEKVSESYKMQKFAGHIINETKKRQESGDYLVTLEIFIDEKMYKEIEGGTFRNPYYLQEIDKIPPSLREVLVKYFGARAHFHGEEITKEGKEKNKVVAIRLNSYAAKEAVKQDEKGNYFALVGDALCAFPFFRAINNGFLNGTKLAESLAEGFKKEDLKNMKSSLRAYSSYTVKRSYIERIKAFVKNLFLNFSKLFLKISREVPWQVVKWTFATRARIEERGNQILQNLSTASI